MKNKNDWLKDHLIDQSEFSLQVRDNYMPIQLTWEEEWYDEMPVLRQNYKEIEADYAMYFASCSQADYMNRMIREGRVITLPEH